MPTTQPKVQSPPVFLQSQRDQGAQEYRSRDTYGPRSFTQRLAILRNEGWSQGWGQRNSEKSLSQQGLGQLDRMSGACSARLALGSLRGRGQLSFLSCCFLAPPCCCLGNPELPSSPAWFPWSPHGAALLGRPTQHAATLEDTHGHIRPCSHPRSRTLQRAAQQSQGPTSQLSTSDLKNGHSLQ
jgi:hypothetical protein